MHAKPGLPPPPSLPTRRQAGDADLPDAYLSLALEVLRRTQGLLLRMLPAAEKAFAKRTLEEEDEVEDKLVNPAF